MIKREAKLASKKKREFPAECVDCETAASKKRGRPKAIPKPMMVRNLVNWDSPLYVEEIIADSYGESFEPEDNDRRNDIIVHRPLLKGEQYPVIVTIIGKKGAAIQKTITARFTLDGISETVASEENAVICISNVPEKYQGWAVVFCVCATSRADGPTKLVVASNTYATRDALIADVKTIFQPLKDTGLEEDDDDSEIYDIPGLAEYQSLNDIYRAICKVNIEVLPHRTSNYDDSDEDGIPDID